MDPRRRRNIAVIAAGVVIVIAVAIVILLSQASRILRYQLEQALGKNFAVESVSVGWNRVEATGPRFMKKGRVTARAKRIVLRPDILSLLKPGFSVSSVTLEEPYLTVEIDEDGKWVMPVAPGKEPAASPVSKPGPLAVGSIEIRDGALSFRDRRRPEPNRIELTKINLRLDRLAYPFGDEPSRFDARVQIEGKLVSGTASGSGTVRFDTPALDGKFEGSNLVLLDGGSDGPAARVQNVSFKAAMEGAGARSLLLSDLVLHKPYLRLQTDRKGKIASPLPVGPPQEEPGEKRKGEAALPVEVKNLTIEGGELLYLDGKIARPPFPVRITDIDLKADRLSFPADERPTAFTLAAKVPGKNGTGVLTSSGTTALKTLDTDARASLRNLDLTGVKPYVLKEGDVDLSRGFLDLDVDLGIRNRAVRAPSRSVLRDLRFASGRGLADEFLGVPRGLVVKAMQEGGDRITIDFIVEGSLDNPQFSLRESMITRLTVGLAKSLGLGVVETGGQVIIRGGRIMKGVGDAVKQIFK